MGRCFPPCSFSSPYPLQEQTPPPPPDGSVRKNSGTAAQEVAVKKIAKKLVEEDDQVALGLHPALTPRARIPRSHPVV